MHDYSESIDGIEIFLRKILFLHENIQRKKDLK